MIQYIRYNNTIGMTLDYTEGNTSTISLRTLYPPVPRVQLRWM